MAPPVEEQQPKVLVLPLPPLPIFYQTQTEGDAMASLTPASSHAKKTSQKQKSELKAVATLEVRSKSKADQLPPARPALPPAKPPFIEAAPRANPTKADNHSLHSVKPPPSLPPPPVLELDEQGKMTYRYSRHHTHSHKPEKDPQPRAARIITIPPPPPGFPGFESETKQVEQCTLTIYHVCRICMRPRSEKYHLEHPILANGVPPPSGICKRCRIKCVDQKDDHTEVVHIEESDKVRVGISAFLPKESLYTREEAHEAIKKQHQKGYAERFIRESSSEEDDPERVVYRYIKRTRKSGPNPPVIERAEVSAENLAAMNLMNDQYSPRLERSRTTLEANGKIETRDKSATRYLAEEIRVAEVARAESSEASVPAKSLKSSKPASATTKDHSTRASVSVKTSVAGSQSNVQATAQVTAPPGYTESEIRIFARDEVERYRQAERMVHAHPNAFTHGRLVPVVPAVPVERRIEVVRDKAVPKPWEQPSSPPNEPIFTTHHSERSAASNDRPGHFEKARSDDSRYWSRMAGNATSGTKSTSSKSSTTIAKDKPPVEVTRHSESRRSESRRTEAQRYEHDVKVVVERGRRPLPPQQVPESDAPVSVKLKEVVGMIREEPMHTKQPSVSSTSRHDLNVIEVYEEIELPPRSRSRSASVRPINPVISQRVKILRAEPDLQRQHRSRHAAPKDREEASLRTDKSYWEDEGTIKTASGHSSMRQGVRTEAKTGSVEHASQYKQETVERETAVLAVPSSRQDLPKLSIHGRSDDASWYASRIKSVKKHQQTPDRLSYDQTQHEVDDDKTVWPADEQPVRPAASERASLREDWDWEYKKRVVTAIDHPHGGRHDEGARERQVTERIFRRRHPSEPVTRTEEVDHQPSARTSGHPQESQHPIARPTPKFNIRSRIEEKGPTHDRGRGPYMHNATEETSHVRFASKIEFSPTPPNSNESLPEKVFVQQSKPSSSTASKGQQRKKSALRNQIDGGASEPPESAEDLISIYEAKRYLGGCSVEGREDLEYISAKCASSATKGSAMSGPRVAADSARSEPRSFHSQPSRRANLEREDDLLPSKDEERRWRSSRRDDFVRRSSPGGADTETATQLSREKRLARALSESPSRENMRMRVQRQQKQEQEAAAEELRGRRDWLDSEVDGKGPYREEARTESMDALYGSSGHGGPQEKEHEYVVRGRW